jgi:periplasmic protein TonB
MKKLIFLLIFLCTKVIFAQDTILFNFKDQKVNNWNVVSYYKIQNFDSLTNLTKVSTFDSLGILKNSIQYSNVEKKIKDGQSIQFYQNGEIRIIEHYVNDKKEGELKTFFKNGQIKRIEQYLNGAFIEGKCYDSTGKKIKFFEYEVMPQFPKGQDKFFNYLAENLQYPDIAREKHISGSVIISFAIDKDGSIVNVYVLESDNEILNNEALRVIQNMPKWIPCKIDGEPVKITYQIPIKFTANQ